MVRFMVGNIRGGSYVTTAKEFGTMEMKNRSVAARTLIMAGALVLGIAAALAAKGLITTWA